MRSANTARAMKHCGLQGSGSRPETLHLASALDYETNTNKGISEKDCHEFWNRFRSLEFSADYVYAVLMPPVITVLSVM